jgi:hypothetical protein
LGLSFDGNLSIDYSQQASGYIKGSKTFERASSSTGSSMTFARSTFSPSLAFKMLKWNASLSLYTGMETGVAFSGGGGSVFFNTEDFNGQDKVGRKHLVVGYDNMGADISSELYSSDFSRERDGNVTAFSPYLPVSNYTYDSYSSTGQGLSGYFRPKRNDIGRIHDPYMYNTTYGASLSLEIGAGSGTKAGFQVNLSYGNNQQGVWNDNNELRS